MLSKCVFTILEFNWDQRFRGKKIILNICQHMLTSITTAEQVISRCGKNENIYEMSKDEKRTTKPAKLMFLMVKYANL